MARKKKTEAPATPAVDISSFLPGDDEDLSQYLNKPEPKKSAAYEPPKAKPKPREYPELANLNAKAFGAVLDQQREMAATKYTLNLKPETTAAIDEEGMKSRTGVYDYDSGMLFKNGALSGDLRHFHGIHSLHNMVEDALDKHMQLAMAKGDSGMLSRLDDVGNTLLESYNHLDGALQKHMSGKATSEEKGSYGNKTVVPGSIQGMANSVRKLQEAARKMSDLTDGQFNHDHIIEESKRHLNGYQGQHFDVVAPLVLGGTKDLEKQRQLEARARVRTDKDDPVKPQPLNLPLEKPGYAEVRRRIRRDKAAEAQEIGEGKRPQPNAPVAGKPREMFMAKPDIDVELKMDYKPSTNEVSGEEGEAALSAKLQNRADLRNRALEKLQGVKRAVRRQEAFAKATSPEAQQRAEQERQEQVVKMKKLVAPPTIRPERKAAFEAQQEGTTLTSAKQQPGTSIRESEPFRNRVAQLVQQDHAVVKGHIASGNILQAAIEHFNRLGPTQVDDFGDRKPYSPGEKKQGEMRKSILKDPHAYLRKEGYDIGFAPRQEQPAEVETGEQKIRVTREVAKGTAGEVVSRAKLNTRQSKSSAGFTGSSTKGNYSNTETRISRREAFRQARADFNQVMGPPRED